VTRLFYTIESHFTAGLARVRHWQHGQQVWAKTTAGTRKAQTCAVCGAAIPVGTIVYRPAIPPNAANRADRMCVRCVEGTPG
jgi:hypothetical protein